MKIFNRLLLIPLLAERKKLSDVVSDLNKVLLYCRPADYTPRTPQNK